MTEPSAIFNELNFKNLNAEGLEIMKILSTDYLLKTYSMPLAVLYMVLAVRCE
jgi:hypothetical protein